MNKGMSLSELAASIESATAEQRDMLVSAQSLNAQVVKSDERDIVAIEIPGTALVEPTATAQGQMSSSLGIPQTYWKRCLEEDPELLVHNVNAWLQRSDDQRLLRLQGPSLRGYLSDRYKRIDNPQVLRESLKMMQTMDTDVVPLASHVDSYGEKFRLKLLFPDVVGEVKPGDKLRSGGSHQQQRNRTRDFHSTGVPVSRLLH